MNENPNLVWARAVAQELARGGVQHVAVAPGSRSAPLVLALHDEAALRLSTHHDERSAAFFSLGAAKATDRPAAVVTTSGTAVANLLPAAVEAHHAQAPLVLITADRPPELHDVGANQTIQQLGLFSSFVRFEADAGLPEAVALRVRHLRTLVARGLAFARGTPAGAVHLNFPFREPLEARPRPGDVAPPWAHQDPVAERGRPGGAAFTEIPRVVRSPEPGSLVAVAEGITRRRHGLIVAGPRTRPDGFASALLDLARRTGYPVLADPLSGLRYGHGHEPEVLSAYDAFLADPALRARVRPDLILRFGAAPTSKSLLSFLAERADADQILVDETGRLGEETARVRTVLAGDAPVIVQELLHQLKGVHLPPAPAWTAALRRIEDATWSVLAPETARRPFEGAAAARLVRTLAPGSVLFVANSLPVRDVDRFARGSERPLRLLGNRGASGIDGTLSTALGAAYALGRRVAVLTGDLAFLHDLGALSTTRRLRLPVDIILINNDGGGIFELLPVSEAEPPFTELFSMPHGLHLGRISDAFGIPHRRLTVQEALEVPLVTETDAAVDASLTEIISDRKENARHRRELETLVARALAHVDVEAPHAP